MQEENKISKRKAMEGKVRKGKLWNGKRRNTIERLIVFGQQGDKRVVRPVLHSYKLCVEDKRTS